MRSPVSSTLRMPQATHCLSTGCDELECVLLCVPAVRITVCVLSLLLSLPLQAAGPDLPGLESTFERIIRTAGGEVGVALVHVETGARISINGDRRFPMASVYKLPIAVEL